METKRQLRRENRELREQCALERRNAIAARGDEGLANREAEMWERRAIEWADRVTEVEYELRELRRINAAYERAAHRELPGRPARRGHGAVLEVAS